MINLLKDFIKKTKNRKNINNQNLIKKITIFELLLKQPKIYKKVLIIQLMI